MKYLRISHNETLTSLTSKTGVANVDQVLADNGIRRGPNVGKYWSDKVTQLKALPNVNTTRKLAVLNNLVDNFDIYQHAALLDENSWKVLSTANAFPNYLYVSSQIENDIPNSYDTLGNSKSVPRSIYQRVSKLLKEGKQIDANLFNTYSTTRTTGLITNALANRTSSLSSNPMSWFKIPRGEVTLYSSLSNTSIDIPAYPEEVNDGRSANYSQMPDLLYQYEPWQIYNSSGPRTNTYSFHLHRDMWTGDHNDGKANELVRFCQAQLYADYKGASVNTSLVTLYVKGKPLIRGIMTQVNPSWSGPLGHDGWYLDLNLSLTITEVSDTALNFVSISEKGLIG